MSTAHFNVHSDERVAIFIDGANLNAASRKVGFQLDFAAIRKHFASESRFIRPYYYTAVPSAEDYAPIHKLVDWLRFNGYHLTTKLIKEQTDDDGRRNQKGNLSVELALDMFELADRVDHVVLFSGDGDFTPVVQRMQAKGVIVTVVCAKSMTSEDLRGQADNFIDLAAVRDIVEKKAE